MNKLGAEGARALAPALMELKQLQHLDLHGECTLYREQRAWIWWCRGVRGAACGVSVCGGDMVRGMSVFDVRVVGWCC